MAKIFIFGAGENAEVAHYYFQNQSDHDVVAFAVDDQYVEKTPETLLGLPVVKASELTTRFPCRDYRAFVAIGYSGLNSNRAGAYRRLKELGYTFESFISPDCHCYTKNIGENAFILEDNTIQPFVKIGNNVVLWSGNHIGHHSVIGDHCFITSHVVVSGGVVVGEYSFLGVNATIRDHVRIGAQTMVGMGALLVKSTEPQSVIRAPKSELMGIKSTELKGM